MTYESSTKQMEIYRDETPVAKINAIDEYAAEVEINLPGNVESWQELSTEVFKGLVSMGIVEPDDIRIFKVINKPREGIDEKATSADND